MSQPSSLPDADEELLVDFQKEYVSAANRAAALEQWCARHVPLVQRLRARAVMVDAFAKAQPEAQPEAVESVKAEPLQLGEFRIDGTIGGGMEKVYLAWQPRLNRKVAIKTVRGGRSTPDARERFLRQQRVLAGLHQTHIVPIFAAGEEG